ncbi:hypothetical protein D3C86_1340610 [compost metagenome]
MVDARQGRKLAHAPRQRDFDPRREVQLVLRGIGEFAVRQVAEQGVRVAVVLGVQIGVLERGAEPVGRRDGEVKVQPGDGAGGGVAGHRRGRHRGQVHEPLDIGVVVVEDVDGVAHLPAAQGGKPLHADLVIGHLLGLEEPVGGIDRGAVEPPALEALANGRIDIEVAAELIVGGQVPGRGVEGDVHPGARARVQLGRIGLERREEDKGLGRPAGPLVRRLAQPAGQGQPVGNGPVDLAVDGFAAR